MSKACFEPSEGAIFTVIVTMEATLPSLVIYCLSHSGPAYLLIHEAEVRCYFTNK